MHRRDSRAGDPTSHSGTDANANLDTYAIAVTNANADANGNANGNADAKPRRSRAIVDYAQLYVRRCKCGTKHHGDAGQLQRHFLAVDNDLHRHRNDLAREWYRFYRDSGCCGQLYVHDYWR